MERNPTVQHLTWFLDLRRFGQLNISPSYQRRSVWNPKDRKLFLDTIFKNYPAPTIFLHRDTDENGRTVYNVVDGKQRLETIFMFMDNKISIDKNFGDTNFNGKKFSDLRPEERKLFFNYKLVVDYIDNVHGESLNNIFDRLNRNSKNLNEQELRHAKYSGWFIQYVEDDLLDSFWTDYKISTPAKARRMKDVQFVSELLIIILENRIAGFDQDYLDEIYAKYDNVTEEDTDESEVDIEGLKGKVSFIKQYIKDMERANNCILKFFTENKAFYILWAVIALSDKESLNDPEISAGKCLEFFNRMKSGVTNDKEIANYNQASTGANTDLSQREIRYNIISKLFLK